MTFPTGKNFWQTVAVLGVVELGSWFAYTIPSAEQYIASSLVVIVIGLAWKRPVWLAYASIAELVVGGKGYLFFLHAGPAVVSIRMILFAALLAATVIGIYRQWASLRASILNNKFLWLTGWLAIAVFIGLIRHNPSGIVYADANAFIYLALLPAWWLLLRPDRRWRTRILAILLAGATIIGLKSWLMLLLFGQDLNNIRQIYTWIRNTGVGEITHVSGNMYRIFFQSQIYSLLILGASLVIYARHHPPRWWLIPMAAASLGVYISMSRSLWLGLLAMVVILLAWVIRRRSWSSARRILILLPLGIFSWLMFNWALNFPMFSFTSSKGGGEAVASRLKGTGSTEAATSRQNQIRPLLQGISRHPVIGSGFGTTATYLSNDPRSPGMRTTTAFELGYLDLWLKIGLFGLILYGLWIVRLWRRIARTAWAGWFIFSGLALIVVNLTTPYLNHPLGLGWLMLTSLFAYDPG